MYSTPIYNLKGIPEAVKRLGFRINRLQSFRTPLEMIRHDFFQVQKGWMDSEGRGSWSELRPRYLKWKVSKVGEKPILQFSGKMYDDVTGRSSGGTDVGATSLTIRAVKSGARWLYHERGLSVGNKSGRPRPKRKVLSPALYVRKARWNRMIRDWAAGENLRRV